MSKKLLQPKCKVYQYFIVYAFVKKGNAHEGIDNIGLGLTSPLDTMEDIQILENLILSKNKDLYQVRIMNSQLLKVENI